MEEWITVNGKHILIGSGESREEAISRAIATKNAETKERQIAKNKADADKLNGKGDVKNFKDGDTPKVLSDVREYRLIKESDKGTSDAGMLPGSDVKYVLKGFKFNGLFWENPNVKYIYEVREK